MKILKEIGLLLVPNIRGMLYLDAFVRHGVLPGSIIVQGTDNLARDLRNYPREFFKRYAEFFSLDKDLHYYQNNYPLNLLRLSEKDVNSASLQQIVQQSPEEYFFFTGGGIIRQPLFATEKKFIHIHPGRLPDYKGSTCLYYELLREGRCAATSFFMAPGLDTGNIILSADFQPPQIPAADWYFFDFIYDAWIRAQVMALTLKTYLDNGCFPSKIQAKDQGDLYYVIHPFLKHLALARQTSSK